MDITSFRNKPNDVSILIAKSKQLLKDVEELNPIEFTKKYGGKMIIKKVSSKVALSIIEKNEPRGLFYYKFGNLYIGIDNSTGNSWTQKFKKYKNCKRWLTGGNYGNTPLMMIIKECW